jgi:coenzyme F420-reducing hydrogenase alpha subunit
LIEILNKLTEYDENKLLQYKTIPLEKEERETFNTSIKNTIVLWKEALEKINEIIKKYEEEKKAKALSTQTGGKKHHSKKSKKRKSKSKASRLKLTRKIASK